MPDPWSPLHLLKSDLYDRARTLSTLDASLTLLSLIQLIRVCVCVVSNNENRGETEGVIYMHSLCPVRRALVDWCGGLSVCMRPFHRQTESSLLVASFWKN
jgi:hypothetical protein